MKVRRTFVVAILLLAAAVVHTAQERPAPASAITFTVTAEGVRFAALGSVRQMRLEVFSQGGDSLYSSSFRAGNVRDWELVDGQGQRLPDGAYLCVVTARDVSGRMEVRQGTVLVQDGQPSLQLAEGEQAAPVEPEQALAPVPDGPATAMTLTAHDGQEGQVVSTKGALSFRLGDFFSGRDKERMRLTEDGKLGIGTDDPRATLDVAGTLRVGTGVEFADGTVLSSADGFGRKSPASAIEPLLAGTGTTGRLVKWADGASGTLGNSVASEANGNLVLNGGNLQMTAAASSTKSTNVFFLDSNTKTGGFVASATPGFLAANGPFFYMRGNAYSIAAGQRGLLALSAGNVTRPAGRDGSIIFNTGADVARMAIKPSGRVGIGTESPAALLHVLGDVEASGNLVLNGGNLQMRAAPTTTKSTNVFFLDSNAKTMGLVASATPGLTAANGPLFYMRGNAYSLAAGQRGMAVFSAGNVTSPTGREGSLHFNTGADQVRMVIKPSGRVGIGTESPASLLHVAGDINVTGNAVVAGNIAAKYQDVAEWVPATQPIPAGTVVVLDATRANTVEPSSRAYDTHVAGVVSAQPGVILGEPSEGHALVATTGRVRVKVDATRGPVRIGDLLVTSDRPGVAMRSRPVRAGGTFIHRPGTIIGKALEPLAGGVGEILVLLSLQ